MSVTGRMEADARVDVASRCDYRAFVDYVGTPFR